MAESKQIGILRFIYNKLNNEGYAPTIREIGEAVDLSSTSTVHGHLDRLKKHNYIKNDPNRPRFISITDEGLKLLGIHESSGRIPMIGAVAAGQPILATENITDEFFPIPKDLEKFDGELFMLNVIGDSMINIGILNGDNIIVRKQNDAHNGQIVVAMTDDFGGEGEATVKRFYKEDGHYRLQPENDNMEPIIVNNVQILGIVVGLYRNKF
ncbi:MAG: transcriptional repressor LexA [Lactobacillaceae bacterium]|jgi:repressor LexA|nr:transcriptional repressor LexA [Lactobacillaceae bacterium]